MSSNGYIVADRDGDILQMSTTSKISNNTLKRYKGKNFIICTDCYIVEAAKYLLCKGHKFKLLKPNNFYIKDLGED